MELAKASKEIKVIVSFVFEKYTTGKSNLPSAPPFDRTLSRFASVKRNLLLGYVPRKRTLARLTLIICIQCSGRMTANGFLICHTLFSVMNLCSPSFSSGKCRWIWRPASRAAFPTCSVSPAGLGRTPCSSRCRRAT